MDRTSHTVIHELTGPAFTGDPHGIWGTPDGGKLYLGHERGNRVTVIDTGDPSTPFDDVVRGLVTGSVADLAFLKQPIDIVVPGAGPGAVDQGKQEPGRTRPPG